MPFRKEKEIQGHSGAIYSCSYDGEFLYSGSADKFVARWLTDEGIQDKFAINFEHALYCIATFQQFLLVGRSDGGFHVFNTATRTEEHYFTQHTKAIFSIAVNAEKAHCYLGDADGNLSVWNLTSWELLLYLPLDSGKIRDIAVHQEGKKIAVCSQDGTLRVFDTENFNEIHTIQAHKDGATSVCFLPNSELLVSGGKDAMLRLWDVSTEKCLKEIPAHNFAIYRLVCVGDQLVSVSRDKTIKVWSRDLDFQQRLDQKDGGHRHSINDCVRLDEDYFATCGDDKRIILWKMER